MLHCEKQPITEQSITTKWHIFYHELLLFSDLIIVHVVINGETCLNICFSFKQVVSPQDRTAAIHSKTCAVLPCGNCSKDQGMIGDAFRVLFVSIINSFAPAIMTTGQIFKNVLCHIKI